MPWDDYDSTYYLTKSGWSKDPESVKSAVWMVLGQLPPPDSCYYVDHSTAATLRSLGNTD